MRPYQIPTSSIWVDLDTIQSIHEPYWEDCNYSAVRMNWHHAFRDGPDDIFLDSIDDGPEADRTPNPKFDMKNSMFLPVYDENGLTLLDRFHNEVFIPFFKEWCGQDLPLKEGQATGEQTGEVE